MRKRTTEIYNIHSHCVPPPYTYSTFYMLYAYQCEHVVLSISAKMYLKDTQTWTHKQFGLYNRVEHNTHEWDYCWQITKRNNFILGNDRSCNSYNVKFRNILWWTMNFYMLLCLNWVGGVHPFWLFISMKMFGIQ